MPNDTPDGRLVVVSSDGARAAGTPVPNLLTALERWTDVEPALRAAADDLDAGRGDSEPFDERRALAPLPRTWQWLDASAFLKHGELLSRSMNVPPVLSPVPLMYQGMSDGFLPPRGDVSFVSVDADLDFEGEYAVVLREVPRGVGVEEAADYIALATFVNDWSFRRLVAEEMGRRFGYIQSKPATGAAPLVATLDELGSGWSRGRIVSPMHAELNGVRFGDVPGDEMSYSFAELIAHAAATRTLIAGTVLGSGTVSSTSSATTGSACIAERRGIELIESGEATTPYLTYGDRVTLEVRAEGRAVFGRLDQRVVPA